MSAIRRNLVISPIGDGSVHASWLSDPQSRTYDLFLINYGNGEDLGRLEATYYARQQGFKWELMDYALKNHGEILGRYTNIWAPDCDIRATTSDVNRLFSLFERYHLQLAQPAIAKGEVTYKSLVQRPGVILRYTPFVEVMCPVFTRQAFWKVSPTFLENRSGWGLDLIWPRFFQPHEMAILDAVGVEHTGALWRGESYQRLAQLGINPGQDLERAIARHGGFKRRLHRKMVRGTIKLPAIREPSARVGLVTRLIEGLGLRGVAA
jgi:hypothetical protein